MAKLWATFLKIGISSGDTFWAFYLLFVAVEGVVDHAEDAVRILAPAPRLPGINAAKLFFAVKSNDWAVNYGKNLVPDLRYQISLRLHRLVYEFTLIIRVTRKKTPNVYKSCPKMISLEK